MSNRRVYSPALVSRCTDLGLKAGGAFTFGAAAFLAGAFLGAAFFAAVFFGAAFLGAVFFFGAAVVLALFSRLA